MLKRLAAFVRGAASRLRAASRKDADMNRRIFERLHDPADADRDYELLIGERNNPPPGG
jgi:hypothetical protein